MILLCWLAWAAGLLPLGAEAGLVFSDDLLRLGHGSGSIRLIVRNGSAREWRDLELEVTPEAPVELETRPGRILRCPPGDRCVFALDARARPDTPQRRFGARVRLVEASGPLLSTPLLIDASARALDRERGWMDAGSISVGSGSPTSRVLALTLLSVVPVAGLLLVGWWLRRRAKRPAG